MTSYLVIYQIRRKEGISTWEGDWQDKKDVVVAGDDASEAVDAIRDTWRNHDFLLKGVEGIGQVSEIAKSVVSKTNPIGQVSQNTIE